MKLSYAQRNFLDKLKFGTWRTANTNRTALKLEKEGLIEVDRIVGWNIEWKLSERGRELFNS